VLRELFTILCTAPSRCLLLLLLLLALPHMMQHLLAQVVQQALNCKEEQQAYSCTCSSSRC
jgi:hypothetical protein